MFAARLRAYAPGGAALGLLPDPLSWQASVVHGDLGALSVTYSTLSAGGPLIARPLADGLEVAVEVWDGAGWVEPRGCRFVRVAQGADVADDMQVYSVMFTSYGWLLGKARLTAGTFTDGRRVFTAPQAGGLVGDLLAENATLGGVPVSVIGGGATDAAGAAWPTLPDQGFEYAADYLGIVRGLQEAGALDWATQARGLYLYLPDSAALSPTTDVRLTLGRDIGEAPADETIEALVSQVAVRAQAGGTVVVDEPTAPTPWGTWQGSLAVGQVDNQAAAEAMGQAELERTGHAREQYTRALILHDGAPVPLLDYWPGAWITAPTDVLAELVRVQQVTLTYGSEGYGGNVVLNDRLLDGDIRRARTLGTLAGGQVGSGGAPAPIAVDPEASRVPSTPTGLDTTAAVVFVGSTPRGVVTASWNAVTTATDSGSLAIAGYELQWRIGAGAWQAIRTAEVSAQIRDLTPGDAITTRVRAVGARTTLPSAWSATDSVTVPGDVTPPPVPTGITVDGAMTVVSVTWDGTPAMPADFAGVQIAIGDTETPTTIAGTLREAGTLQVDQALTPIGAPRFVRARSVDTTGNPSAWTTALPVAAESVVADEIDDAINDAIDQALTGPVDGARLTPWTVLPDRVLIANIANLLADPNFQSGAWQSPDWIQAPGTGKDGAASYLVPAGTTQRGGYFGAVEGNLAPAVYGVPVKAGASLRLTAWAQSPTAIATDNARIFVRWYNLADGSFTTSSAANLVQIPAGTWGEVDGVVTAPTTLDNYVAIIGLWAQPGHTDTLRWSLPRARLMSGASLVVDGSITTPKLAVDAVEAGNIAVGALDFKTAEGMELIAPDLKTATSGARVEIDTTGSYWYDEAGTLTVSIVGGTATITGGTVTGALVRTSASGGQARMGGLVGGGGIWANDSTGTSRASIQVSSTVNPGLYLWDSTGATRVFLYTTGTQSVMSFRNPGGTEVLKIADGKMQIFDGGQYVAYYPGGAAAASLGPIYNGGTGTLLGYGALVLDWDGQPLLDVRSGTSTGTGAQANVYARGDADLLLWVFDSGEARFGSDDGSVWIEAGNVSGNGIIQLRAGAAGQSIELVADDNVLIAYAQGNGFIVNVRPNVSGVPAYLSSGGRLGVQSSARRFKTDIQRHTFDRDALLSLQPVSYRAVDAEAGDERYVGLIAEDLIDAGLPEFVVLDQDGQALSLRYELLAVGLVPILRDLAARLDALDGGPTAALARRVAGTVSGQVPGLVHDTTPVPPTPRPPEGPAPTGGIGMPAGARPAPAPIEPEPQGDS